ncbi:MAG: hypothetical protein ACFHWX_04575 [Bacteroidota bacterium]
MIAKSIIFFIIPLAVFLQQKNDYYILFRKIDNQVKVYLEDSLIYQSKLVDGNPELKLRVDLNEYLKPGQNKIKVELINGSGLGFFEMDNNWEIFYEIFNNNDPIDYMSEESHNGTTGVVFSWTHEIFIE